MDQASRLRFLGGAFVLVLLLAAVIEGAFHLGPVADLEQMVDDVAVAYFTSDAETPHPAVAVVAIDADTISRYPPFSPIDRVFLTRLVEILVASAPLAIGVDILLADPVNAAVDDRLAEVLRRSPVPVVMAAALHDGRRLPMAPAFEGTDIRTALANLPIDQRDDVLRRYQTGYRDDNGADHPTLAAALASIATAAPVPPLDQSKAIDWYGRPGAPGTGVPPIATFPAHALLAAPAAAALLKGKVVLVGATFRESRDFVKTPFSRLGDDDDGLPGVMAHAQVAAQLIDGRARPELPPVLRWALVCGALLFTVAITAARLPTAAVIALAGALPVAWIALALFARDAISLPLPALPPALAFGVGLGAFSAYQARRLDKMQRRALRALAQRVPAGVIDEMLASPDLLRLEPQARTISILFTDLASFTTYSTQHSPAAVMGFLREYLEAVSDVVLSHGGTIDKFIGDAVMAFWGAPLEQPDHAERAIACARAIDDRCRALTAPRSLATRVGVHTGDAVVGFLGSRDRLEYTAIGDAVNTASRIEGANKRFGTTVCISGDAIAASGAPPRHQGLLRIGTVRVLGRAQPVALYAPAPPAFDAAHVERYERALDALESGRFGEAEEALDSLVSDGLVAFQLERCRNRRSGVIDLEEK